MLGRDKPKRQDGSVTAQEIRGTAAQWQNAACGNARVASQRDHMLCGSSARWHTDVIAIFEANHLTMQRREPSLQRSSAACRLLESALEWPCLIDVDELRAARAIQALNRERADDSVMPANQ